MLSPRKSPRVHRTSHNTQLTYHLPSRVHVVKTYPVLSPQGATILILGHESGLTIIWLGGRRFKRPTAGDGPAKINKHDGHDKKLNGSFTDSVMVIDSDEENGGPLGARNKSAPPISAEDLTAFEDDAHEGSYPDVVQTLDMPMGTAVLHVAVVPMTPCQVKDAAWGGAEILREKMVLAVSCSSDNVYVVALPLTPPSPHRKARPELERNLLGGRAGSGLYGEVLVSLAGQVARSQGIAMTVAPRSPAGDTSLAGGVSTVGSNARLIVASHTREACGTLRLWDVPLDRLQAGMDDRQVLPFQTEFLPTPLATISFNPTHTTQLLAVFRNQAVRVYDYSLAPIQPDDGSSAGPYPVQGSWLLSLYPPFSRPSTGRKPIVDAAWVVHGRAVLVLLADGTWGFWDVDGCRQPGSGSGSSLFGRQGSGLRGGAVTAFSATGYMEGLGPLRGATDAVHSHAGSGASQSEFVPMTPHTRRDATALLGSTPQLDRLSSVRGGICVTALSGSSKDESGGAGTAGAGAGVGPGAGADFHADESVILWLNGAEHVCVIPGVARFWTTQLRRGAGGGVNLFSGAQPTRMIRLHDLSMGLLSERCGGVAALVSPTRNGSHRGGGGGSDRLPIDVVLCGESRFVVVREADDGPGVRLGGVVDRRRRWAGGKAQLAPRALVVHSRAGRPDPALFDLTINKMDLLHPSQDQDLEPTQMTQSTQSQTQGQEPDKQWPTAIPSRPRLGMGMAFADTMSAAADATDDQQQAGRDVEVEMLDIMDIDRHLEDMEERRDSGRKRVLFDEL